MIMPHVQNLLLCESVSTDTRGLTLHNIINSFVAAEYPAARMCSFFLSLTGGKGYARLFIELINLETGDHSNVHVGGFDFKEPIDPTVLCDKFLLSLSSPGAYELRVFGRPNEHSEGRLLHTFSFTAQLIPAEKKGSTDE